MVWSVGQKLHGDRFTIERELERGHFGITYIGSEGSRNRVVIKTINDDLLHQLTPPEIELLQEKFLQEVVKLAKLRHPHLVQIKEPFIEEDRVCIIMDYIEGTNLATHGQNQLPEQDALRYIQQIGAGLKLIHENGLVHRGVKPGNIIIRADRKSVV